MFPKFYEHYQQKGNDTIYILIYDLHKKTLQFLPFHEFTFVNVADLTMIGVLIISQFRVKCDEIKSRNL